MGYGVAAVTAILATVVLTNGYLVGGKVLDQQEKVNQAMDDAARLQWRLIHTDMAIASVDLQGNTVTVVVDNEGETVLDAGAVDLLVEGQPVVLTSVVVGGVGVAWWPPGSQLTLEYASNQLPSDVVVVAETGGTAYWRA